MNSMRKIKIEKVVLNVGCGGDLKKIEKAKKLLEFLTGRKSKTTLSKKRSTFGVAQRKPVGVKVTLRKKKAEEFLKLALQAVENRLNPEQFDSEGNFSIGIKEYIDLPNIKYQHDIGILGLDVSVSLERPGYRIKRRRIQSRKIHSKQKINKDEAINWLKENFGVEVG
jgi:large subunit ribosomal protein L5